jgi:hypothetical protein
MTGAPPLSVALNCPLPPADLHFRRVPVRIFDLATRPLLRIHRSRYSPLFFNRRSLSPIAYRFDAPSDEYGVLYASPEFDVCMAETLVRDAFQTGPLVLDEFEIADRSISTLGVAGRTDLTLVDLTAPLFPIGGSSAISAVSDYFAPNRWSKAFYDHPEEYDGLYFLSRFSNMPSVALFDRVEATLGETMRLSADPRLPAFLDRYQIALV